MPNTQRGTQPTANHAAAHVKPIPIAPRMRRSHFRMIASDPRALGGSDSVKRKVLSVAK